MDQVKREDGRQENRDGKSNRAGREAEDCTGRAVNGKKERPESWDGTQQGWQAKEREGGWGWGGGLQVSQQSSAHRHRQARQQSKECRWGKLPDWLLARARQGARTQ